ncbi:MAG: ABC transporter substrate-binding protein, partial [Dehalococcoidia bacterium]
RGGGVQEEGNYWNRLAGRRISRRAVLRTGVAGAGAVGLLAAGCGGSSTKSTNTGSAATQAPAATSSGSAAAVAPSAAAGAVPNAAPTAVSSLKTGGTIQLIETGPIALDPFENSSYRAQLFSSLHYSRLFRFYVDAKPETFQSHDTVGDLVQSHEVAPDGLQYTLKLRSGVMFHPPLSRALTSADVLSSYQRFTTDAKNANSGVFSFVDSVTAPDDLTVVWKLKTPYSPLLNKLANPQYLWIMPKEVADGKIDPNKQPAGTGPWIFVSQSPTAFTWKKNPDYYLKGLPYADGVVYNIIPDASTQEAQFQAGKIDVFSPPIADVDSLKKAVPKSNSVNYTSNLLVFMFFTNVMAPDSPFHDVRMRRAASLALDRDALIQVAYNGEGAWSNLVNPGLGKWHLDPKGTEIGDAGKWFKHDPAQAKALIQQAGFADTQFKYIYPNNAYGDVYNGYADAARGMLADAGFKLQVVTVDYQKDYINNGQGIFFKGAPANSIVFALQTRFTDPDDYLSGMLLPDGNRNHSKVNDPSLSALLQQEQKEVDETKRLQLVHQIQKQHAGLLYYVPAHNGKEYAFYAPGLENRFVSNDYSTGTERTPYLSVNRI